MTDAIRNFYGSIKRRHKYNARKTLCDGIVFDSKAEAKRYAELILMVKAGVISDLELQPRFTLLEKQEGQRGIKYVADFRYIENGKTIVEDVKGMQTPVFLIKKKMFKSTYPNIELRITTK